MSIFERLAKVADSSDTSDKKTTLNSKGEYVKFKANKPYPFAIKRIISRTQGEILKNPKTIKFDVRLFDQDKDKIVSLIEKSFNNAFKARFGYSIPNDKEHEDALANVRQIKVKDALEALKNEFIRVYDKFDAQETLEEDKFISDAAENLVFLELLESGKTDEIKDSQNPVNLARLAVRYYTHVIDSYTHKKYVGEKFVVSDSCTALKESLLETQGLSEMLNVVTDYVGDSVDNLKHVVEVYKTLADSFEDELEDSEESNEELEEESSEGAEEVVEDQPEVSEEATEESEEATEESEESVDLAKVEEIAESFEKNEFLQAKFPYGDAEVTLQWVDIDGKWYTSVTFGEKSGFFDSVDMLIKILKGEAEPMEAPVQDNCDRVEDSELSDILVEMDESAEPAGSMSYGEHTVKFSAKSSDGKQFLVVELDGSPFKEYDLTDKKFSDFVIPVSNDLPDYEG